MASFSSLSFLIRVLKTLISVRRRLLAQEGNCRLSRPRMVKFVVVLVGCSDSELGSDLVFTKRFLRLKKIPSCLKICGRVVYPLASFQFVW